MQASIYRLKQFHLKYGLIRPYIDHKPFRMKIVFLLLLIIKIAFGRKG